MKGSHKKKNTNVVDANEHQWEIRFYELKKFKKKFGHCDVSRNTKQYRSLAKWCETQRRQRKFWPLKFNPYRLSKLNKIGFSWSIPDKLFEEKFNLLKQYSKKHGHCNVNNTENHTLAKWCWTIKRERKKKMSRLTRERIARLTELGFVWNTSMHDLRWDQQFAGVKAFKKKHGHFNAIFSMRNAAERNLFRWMQIQRKRYASKSKLLTAEKIAKLNAIGFNWVNQIKPGEANKITDTNLLKELRRLHEKHNVAPSALVINKYGRYSARTYYLHFGSMLKARKAAGLSSAISKPRKRSNAVIK